MMGIPSLMLGLFMLPLSFHWGYYSLPAFMLLATAFIVCVVLVFSSSSLRIRSDERFIVPYLLVSVYALALFFSRGMYQMLEVPSGILALVPSVCFPVILSYLLPHPRLPRGIIRWRFPMLFLVAFVLRISMMWASPSPGIDVFVMLKQAAEMLSRGVNPYSSTFSVVYPGVSPDYYTYWPAAIYLSWPFVMFWSDPRMLLITADMVAAYLLFRFLRRSVYAEALALIYLFRPNALFIIEQSWLTPLEFLLILLTLYCFQKKFIRWTAVVLGVLTGVKALYLVLAPFFFLASQKKKRVFGMYYVATVAGCVLPFILWDWSAFFHDTIAFFLRSPSEMKAVPTHAATTVNTVIYTLTGRDIPVWIQVAIVLSIYTALLRWFQKPISAEEKAQERNLRRIGIIGLVLFTLFMFHRYAFLHYYYLVHSIFLMWYGSAWVSASEKRRKEYG